MYAISTCTQQFTLTFFSNSKRQYEDIGLEHLNLAYFILNESKYKKKFSLLEVNVLLMRVDDDMGIHVWYKNGLEKKTNIIYQVFEELSLRISRKQKLSLELESR